MWCTHGVRILQSRVGGERVLPSNRVDCATTFNNYMNIRLYDPAIIKRRCRGPISLLLVAVETEFQDLLGLPEVKTV